MAASGVGLRKGLRPIRAQWEEDKFVSGIYAGDISTRPWPCYVLVNPAAPLVSLCTVNIYSRIYSNETQVETAEFCRSHAHSTHSTVNHIPFLQKDSQNSSF